MFVKKGAPSAKSLNDPEGVAQASQKGAGNSEYDISQYCYSSGVSPVNDQGQVTDKTGVVQNWPYQKFTIDNELNPRSNEAFPEALSDSKESYGDFQTEGKRVSQFNQGLETLG